VNNIVVPVMQPKLPSYKNVKKYLKQIDKNRTYSNNGPLIQKLEQRYSEFLGVSPSQVVLCSSATLGLEGASYLTAVEEINVPSFTFPASALAVARAGKKLIFQDIDELDWQINVSKVKNKSNSGLMVVLPFGSKGHLDKYLEFENVIIDAAASLGNFELNLGRLQKNWIIVFSLHATKVLGIGEGGLVVFGDSNKANRFRAWVNFGFAGTRDSTLIGTNAKMSEMQAAYGHATLDEWSFEKAEWLKARENIKKLRSDLFKNNFMNEINISPYWIVEFNTSEMLIKFEKYLRSEKIETRSWWSTVHKMPAFIKSNHNNYFAAESVAKKTLGLPFFRDIKSSHLDRIQNAIDGFSNNA